MGTTGCHHGTWPCWSHCSPAGQHARCRKCLHSSNQLPRATRHRKATHWPLFHRTTFCTTNEGLSREDWGAMGALWGLKEFSRAEVPVSAIVYVPSTSVGSVGALSRWSGLPARLLPHIPGHVSQAHFSPEQRGARRTNVAFLYVPGLPTGSSSGWGGQCTGCLCHSLVSYQPVKTTQHTQRTRRPCAKSHFFKTGRESCFV